MPHCRRLTQAHYAFTTCGLHDCGFHDCGLHHCGLHDRGLHDYDCTLPLKRGIQKL